MSARHNITRREFMRRGAAATAGLSVVLRSNLAAQEPSRPVSANDKISVGFIGVGIRGMGLMRAAQRIDGVETVAVCDLYAGHLKKAQELTDNKVQIFGDYRQLLDQKGIDAVIIATPDHWHKAQVLDALAAGKDVYCEKPLTYSIQEGDEIIKAVKRTDRIVQVGSQWLSNVTNAKAREIIKSGALGQITMISASENRNTPQGAWVYPIPPDASPETIDWTKFLGSAPRREFSAERFFRWRCWWDYSGGVATDLFVHYLTAIHHLMDVSLPRSVVAQGGLFRWKDGRDVPDVLNAIYDYGGFVVNLYVNLNNSYTPSRIVFLGTKGTLVYSTNRVAFYPENLEESYRGIIERWPKEIAEEYFRKHGLDPQTGLPHKKAELLVSAEEFEAAGENSTLLHLKAFFESVRARKPSIEDAVVGNNAAVAAHMANLAYKSKKQVAWDQQRQTVSL